MATKTRKSPTSPEAKTGQGDPVPAVPSGHLDEPIPVSVQVTKDGTAIHVMMKHPAKLDAAYQRMTVAHRSRLGYERQVFERPFPSAVRLTPPVGEDYRVEVGYHTVQPMAEDRVLTVDVIA